MKVQGILETALYVDDLKTAKAFYRDVLGLEFFAEEIPRHVFFRCDHAMLLLFNADETLKGGSDRLPHGARGPQHVCFRVPHADLGRWMEHLREQGVTIELDHHWPQGGRSLYFRDPAGNSLELASPIIWGMPEE
jgi:catechol 2,3-dioxygenase-like lactoylglutathione lyase family enzyme